MREKPVVRSVRIARITMKAFAHMLVCLIALLITTIINHGNAEIAEKIDFQQPSKKLYDQFPNFLWLDLEENKDLQCKVNYGTPCMIHQNVFY